MLREDIAKELTQLNSGSMNNNVDSFINRVCNTLDAHTSLMQRTVNKRKASSWCNLDVKMAKQE